MNNNKRTRIITLKETNWSRRIIYLRKELYNGNLEHAGRFADHIINDAINCDISCKSCGISLKDQIGKDVVIHKNSNRCSYYHVDCARQKNIID